MTIYHQITEEGWNSAHADGLKKAANGDKSDRQTIRTDTFLDERLPQSLKSKGVCRCSAVYGYLGDAMALIDIQTGRSYPVTQMAAEKGYVLLRLDVHPRHCWVSDLDLYDTVKRAKEETARTLAAARYWDSLQPLTTYDGSIRRPEIMITHGIPPSQLHRIGG